MVSFITPSLLQSEFNFGWLKPEGLKPYVGWGYITQAQYDDIVNNRPVA